MPSTWARAQQTPPTKLWERPPSPSLPAWFFLKNESRRGTSIFRWENRAGNLEPRTFQPARSSLPFCTTREILLSSRRIECCHRCTASIQTGTPPPLPRVGGPPPPPSHPKDSSASKITHSMFGSLMLSAPPFPRLQRSQSRLPVTMSPVSHSNELVDLRGPGFLVPVFCLPPRGGKQIS